MTVTSGGLSVGGSVTVSSGRLGVGGGSVSVSSGPFECVGKCDCPFWPFERGGKCETVSSGRLSQTGCSKQGVFALERGVRALKEKSRAPAVTHRLGERVCAGRVQRSRGSLKQRSRALPEPRGAAPLLQLGEGALPVRVGVCEVRVKEKARAPAATPSVRWDSFFPPPLFYFGRASLTLATSTL